MGGVRVSHARGRVRARARTGVVRAASFRVGEEPEERGEVELARIDTEHRVSRNCVAVRIRDFRFETGFEGRRYRRICNS